MQCDICLRTGGHKLPFLCATDARNQLYEPRMQHTQVLIENEALDREISALLAAEPAETDTTGLSRPQVDKIISQSQQAEDRTQQIIAHADELRANIEKAREESRGAGPPSTRRGLRGWRRQTASRLDGTVRARKSRDLYAWQSTSGTRCTPSQRHREPSYVARQPSCTASGGSGEVAAQRSIRLAELESST